MPDKRIHRGPHPEDTGLFADNKLPSLRTAVEDFSLLLTKGYAVKSSLKLVGDRFSLTERQRLAVQRCGCSDQQLVRRKQRQVPIDDLNSQPVIIDGYNLLITIEAYLSGAPIFIARDGCYRDLAGIHGSYRKVTETIPALKLISQFLLDLEASHALWLFDSPVSNSGRLKTLIYELAEENNWPWDAELFPNPDIKLIAAEEIIATSDSDILDKCRQWVNLTGYIIKKSLPIVRAYPELAEGLFCIDLLKR